MKTVIIEDEKLNVAELKHLLNELAPQVEIVQVLSSLRTARQWLSENPEPDFYFMDIKLGDGQIFELFDQFCLQSPVIFCTAYEEFAIKAFRVNGVDYLLKPVQTNELSQALERVQRQLKEKLGSGQDMQQLINYFANPNASPSKYKERFIINAHGRLTPVETSNIALFKKDIINYVFLHTGEKMIYDYSSLDQIEELLDPTLFFRLNRQSIININAIQSIKPQPNLKLEVYLKPPLKIMEDVSRDKASLFRKWIDR